MPGLKEKRFWQRLREAAAEEERPDYSPDPMPLGRRSRYLRQVERIAPPELVGREAEVVELTEFCLESDCGPYGWWQAPAWSGKSALLSTFVLHPPEELRGRVHLVSFFVTARLAQDTHAAFTAVLLEQLADLTGQEATSTPTEIDREALLLDQFEQAAHVCQAEGGRLVLVVDGLDEDRGVVPGQDAHSIAGLLPSHPPAGMRVIVAGRPNPPLPDAGCGFGAEAIELTRTGEVDVIGIDNSLAMIEEARRRVSGTGLPISFSPADAADLPFPDNHFDACQAQTLLGHIADPHPVVSELVRVTRPCGRVVLLELDQGSTLLDHPDRATTRIVIQALTESLSLMSCRAGQAPGHERDHGDGGHGFVGVGSAFVVADQAAVAG